MSWLTSSLTHSDPRGTSPDMSMTPAPFTPASSGITAHSREAVHELPPGDSSARIRRSRSPGLSAFRSPAGDPAAVRHARALAHLLLLRQWEGKRQQGLDSTPFRGPDHRTSLLTLPARARQRQGQPRPACAQPGGAGPSGPRWRSPTVTMLVYESLVYESTGSVRSLLLPWTSAATTALYRRSGSRGLLCMRAGMPGVIGHSDRPGQG